MIVQEVINHIRNLLAEDNIPEALKTLTALLKDKPQLDALVQQSGRYNHLLKETRLGILTPEQKNVEMNSIRNSLIELLRELDKSNNLNPNIKAILNSETSQIFSMGNTQIQQNSNGFLKSTWSRVALLISTLLAALGIHTFQKGQTNQQTIQVDGPNTGTINQIHVGDSASNVQITIGETPEAKSNAAFMAIRTEILTNLLNLATRIKAVSSFSPTSFDRIDKRRANEPETAYQDRAKTHHIEYKNEMQRIMNKFTFKTEAFNAHKVNLALNTKLSQSINTTYQYFEEVQDNSNSLIEQLNHILSLNKSDMETTLRNASIVAEKLLDMKINLCQAAAYYGFEEKEEVQRTIIIERLQLADIHITQSAPQAMYSALFKLSAEFQQQKAQVLKDRYKLNEQAPKREVERRVKDPYLIYLRKMQGLPEELSEAQVLGISRKKPDETIVEIDKLLIQSMMSYIESDGNAVEYYFNKALKIKDLNPLQKKYLQSSLERLKNPNLYGGSIGFFLFDIEKGSALAKQGIEKGDILFKINNQVMIDAQEISDILGKTDKNTDIGLDVMNKGVQRKIIVKGSQSLGTRVSPLITFNMTMQ